MIKMTVGVLLVLAFPAEARDAAQVRKFRSQNVCPATLKHTGPCVGFVVDHLIPLCAGGPDLPSNMIWQAKAASLVKDRIEWALCRRLRSCSPPGDV